MRFFPLWSALRKAARGNVTAEELLAAMEDGAYLGGSVDGGQVDLYRDVSGSRTHGRGASIEEALTQLLTALVVEAVREAATPLIEAAVRLVGAAVGAAILGRR